MPDLSEFCVTEVSATSDQSNSLPLTQASGDAHMTGIRTHTSQVTPTGPPPSGAQTPGTIESGVVPTILPTSRDFELTATSSGDRSQLPPTPPPFVLDARDYRGVLVDGVSVPSLTATAGPVDAGHAYSAYSYTNNLSNTDSDGEETPSILDYPTWSSHVPGAEYIEQDQEPQRFMVELSQHQLEHIRSNSTSPEAWDRVIERPSEVELVRFRRTDGGSGSGTQIRVPTGNLFQDLLTGRPDLADRALIFHTEREWESQSPSDWREQLEAADTTVYADINWTTRGTLSEIGDTLFPRPDQAWERRWWESDIWQRLGAYELTVLAPDRRSAS
ncbi:hypothetical protein I316_02475 [Kwoniella heveanensis BCC8398]|uniref:Uncharacterized protein n=1 Tax=Kwoniella heveanensis BCC8398 TaxID=1296120 RepID=A0A1B9GYA4_9TREE|nr:hypothetical protein I316_02475 [Kwoniella heveanensis BCC8398]